MSALAALSPGTFLSLLQRHVVEHVHDVFQLDTGNDCPVDGLRVLDAGACEVDRRKAGEGAARANDPRRVPVARRNRSPQLTPNVLSKLAHPLLFRRGADVLLRHPDGAERQRDQALDQSVSAQRQLERSATDVHHHSSANAKIEVRQRAAKAETRFVVAAKNSYRETGFRPHQLEKLVSVAGIAHGTRGHDLGALDAELIRKRRHPAQRPESVLNGDLVE